MNLDYQVIWSIPGKDWWDISSASSVPSDDILWRQVWADQENATTLLSASPAVFPNGLILLTLQVQAGEKSPASFDLSQSNRWRQSFGIVEAEGDAASPFDLQLDASIDHLAFRYNLSLNCAVPETATGQSRNDFITYCRELWHEVLFNSGLCIISPAATPAPLTWREVSDVNTHYAFEVPASWSEGIHATADRQSFFSLPVHQQPQECPFPDHLIKVDFAADPPGNFAVEGQPPTQGAPDTEEYMPITVAERPAWRYDSRGQELEGGNFAADSTVIYIQGPEYWYFFYFACAPVWTADCEDSLSHILDSFRILP